MQIYGGITPKKKYKKLSYTQQQIESSFFLLLILFCSPRKWWLDKADQPAYVYFLILRSGRSLAKISHMFTIKMSVHN